MFFFFFNSEKRIGIKKLTKADLGLSKTSNQTHIGLYEDVLTFLDDSDVRKEGLLIYDETCSLLECWFDRIATPSGTFRSPKIRKGNDGKSIVDKIRAIAQRQSNLDWYLVWSCLESEQLVFWLFNNQSADYQKAVQVFPKLSMVLTEDNTQYESAKKLFQDKVNGTSIDVQKDIEIASQTGRNVRLYKQKDIENADRLFRKVGREGEELIAKYLEQKKNTQAITSYRWMNANRESGEPFDFIVNEGLPTENFIDVKSTRFGFSQYLYFSSEEVKFVSRLHDDNKYSVYRVYNMEDEYKKRRLRVCTDCMDYMNVVNLEIAMFNSKMVQHQTILQNVKLGVRPHCCFKNVNPSIIL